MLKTLTPNVRGMLAMTGASIVFVFSDVLTKLATGHWSVAQTLAVRGVMAIALTFALVVLLGESSKLKTLADPLLILRSFVEGTVALLFISALSRMPLADLTSIMMLSPLVITALAVLFFGEQVGWRRWGAIVVGFLGLLLVVQPGGLRSAGPEYFFASGLGLASVFAVAARDFITRRMRADIPGIVATLATSLVSCLSGIVLSAIEPWRPLTALPFLFCAGAAAIVTLGNILIIMACRGVDLSVVAPFRYSSVIWSILLGYVVFGDVPNGLAVIGMAIIVASGLYLMHRERLRQHAPAKR